MASVCIQRWALTMAMYEYWSTAARGDAMSRLPLPESPQGTPLPPEMILSMEELNTILITAVSSLWVIYMPVHTSLQGLCDGGWFSTRTLHLSLRLDDSAHELPLRARKYRDQFESHTLLWGRLVKITAYPFCWWMRTHTHIPRVWCQQPTQWLST